MKKVNRVRLALLTALVVVFTISSVVKAQTSSATVYHQIEGRVHFRSGGVGNIRVRLLKMPDMRPITETFSRPEGQFTFNQVGEGEYIVEAIETDQFESAMANVSVRPLIQNRRSLFTVQVELSLRPAPERTAPGVVTADVDVNVPKAALKRYRKGMQALDKQKHEDAVEELRAAIEIYADYYAARLELGRELRLQKRFGEADEVLRPLEQIAPRQAEPRIERGIVLLSLERRQEAIDQLRAALRLEDSSWAAHLFLGWALLDTNSDEAEPHFQRALEIAERKAARAHLALARIADARGQRRLALRHLDAYIALSPDAHDADGARKLAERLRTLP